MWLIIPLIYFLAWWQTGSFRQAFNATIAWIIGYGIAAGTILLLDVGGYDTISATPDSPGAALAILGGFIAMWISNIIWRRRGGDPPREPGKWERAFRAMASGEQKPKKKKKRPAAPTQPQVAPPPARPQQPAPVDAQYRPAPNQPQGAPQYQAAQTQPPYQGPVQQKPAPAQEPRNSPTADKYAKATGRALGAMFRSSSSSSKKRPRKKSQG